MQQPPPLRIEAFASLADLAPWRESLDALNLAARRPSPFHTLDYLEAFLASDEYEVPGTVPRLLLAWDGERLVGFLPLRRRPERVFGLRRYRLEFLTTHDTERPALVARREDEARCAEAFLRYLARREKGWTFLELMEQDADSPFWSLPGLDRRRYLVRQFPNNPGATVPLDEPSFEEWFERLDRERSKHIKYKLATPARALLAAGDVEFVACEDREAAPELLDLYVELEARSWKAQAKAGIGRHPRRVELFRRMVQLRAFGMPVFHFVMYLGVPIAAMLSLSFGETAYQMETVFDTDFAQFSPGNLLFLLGVRDVMARDVRAYNLLTNFAYHKSRWGATIVETYALQAYRRWSLHHLKAALGALRRRWLGAPLQQNQATHNLTKEREGVRAPATQSAPHAAAATTATATAAAPASAPAAASESARESAPAAPLVRPEHEPLRAHAAHVLAEVAEHGGLRRLSGDAIATALPFVASRAGAKPPKPPKAPKAPKAPRPPKPSLPPTPAASSDAGAGPDASPSSAPSTT